MTVIKGANWLLQLLLTMTVSFSGLALPLDAERGTSTSGLCSRWRVAAGGEAE